MRLRLTLLLLCFALPAYADTLTATVNRDNGVTQTTEPLVLTPANIGAQPDVKGVAGLDIFQNSTGARFPYLDFHSNDGNSDYTARISQWDTGALQFQNSNTLSASSSAFSFEGSTGTFRVKQPAILQRVTAPTDFWNMYPAVEHSIEFPKLGVGSAYQGFASWLVSAGPTPAQVTANSNGASWGIIGQEINTFERYADQTYKESTNGRWSAGIQMVPESELSIFGGSPQQGYNGNFGIRFAHSLGSDYSDAGRTYPSAKWHVPLIFDTDSTTPTGTTILMKGGASAGTQPNKSIKVTGYHNDVIDTSGATVAGSVLKVAPAQTFTDGTVTKTLAQLAAGQFTASGDTTVAATVSGAKTAGKQITFDASGNVVASAYDAGATGGGGSGTVSSGTTGQFAYYSGAGTTVTGRTLVAGDIPAIPESGVTNLTTDLAAKAPLAPSYITIGTDATLTNERVLTGTTNRITVTDGGAGGAVTISTPQDINTTSVSRYAGLNINGGMGATAGQILMNGNAGTATLGVGSTYIVDTANSLAITKTAASGTNTIDYNPKVTDGTSASTFRFFNVTNTSGSVGIDIYKGDNTASINSHLDGKSDSYFQVLGGNFGVGTNSPGKKLDVNGVARAKSFEETVKPNGTCSTSINIDPTLGGVHTLTLSGACAIGVTNLAAGQSFTLKLTQSSTTAPTFTSAYKWPAATQPTWSTSATKYDVLSCYSDDGTSLLCNGMVDVR